MKKDEGFAQTYLPFRPGVTILRMIDEHDQAAGTKNRSEACRQLIRAGFRSAYGDQKTNEIEQSN